jgi:hypothetical protein
MAPVTAGSAEAPERRPLPAAAERALAEAAARRAARDGRPPPPAEHHGPTGPDPVRYGDWERKGIASDF